MNVPVDIIGEIAKHGVAKEFRSCCKTLRKDKWLREIFVKRVNWNRISLRQKLSEDFIREFREEVNWEEISRSQKLSENFIRGFRKEVNWYWISEKQNLSKEFAHKF